MLVSAKLIPVVPPIVILVVGFVVPIPKELVEGLNTRPVVVTPSPVVEPVEIA
jgi:hypothetical protein